MPRGLQVGLSVVVGVLVASACFTLERHRAIEPGSIGGVAVRADKDGEPARFSRIVSVNAGTTRRADKDGVFVVQGLAPGSWAMRFVDDSDGDGRGDREALRAIRISTAADGTTDAVLLGDVGLDGTFEIQGAVTISGVPGVPAGPPTGAVLAKVYAIRSLDVVDVASARSDLQTLLLGVEQEASVDANGRFRFLGVGSGDVQLVGAFFERTPDGKAGGLLGLSAPVLVSGIAGDTKDTTTSPLEIPYDATLGGARRSIQLGLAPAPSGAVTVRFVGVDGTIIDELTVDGGASVVLDAPIGLSNLELQDADGKTGTLPQQLLLPEGLDVTDGSPLWGPVLLSAVGPCGPSGDDCDGDGLSGLPRLDVDEAGAFLGDTATWAACTEACTNAFGAEGGDATCEAPGGPFDCEDDGDGQPDVTEHPRCYGPGLGTDLDGDGLCEPGDDPFPLCKENDPAAPACAADAPPPPPPPPQSFPEEPLPVTDGGDGGDDAGPQGCSDGTHDNGLGACVPTVTSLASGDNHSCAVVQGRVKCWGRNTDGQTGKGTAGGNDPSPATVVLESGAELADIVEVTAGSGHTCARDTSGSVFCWGRNTKQQTSAVTDAVTPTGPVPFARPVPGLPAASEIVGLSAGADHTCALARASVDQGGLTSVVCWGDGSNGQLGDRVDAQPREGPVTVGFSEPVTPTSLSAGARHTCVSTAAGDVWCWGDGGNGQLGQGFTEGARGLAQRVTALGPAQGVYASLVVAGASHTCVLILGANDANEVRCFGANLKGQVNGVASAPANEPVPSTLPTGAGVLAGVVALDARNNGTCAVGGATPVCWGDGGDSQFGGAGSLYAPTQFPAWGPARALSLGTKHACALGRGGAVVCAGDGSFGQIGDGTVRSAADDTPVPAVVADLGCASGVAYDPATGGCVAVGRDRP